MCSSVNSTFTFTASEVHIVCCEGHGRKLHPVSVSLLSCYWWTDVESGNKDKQCVERWMWCDVVISITELISQPLYQICDLCNGVNLLLWKLKGKVWCFPALTVWNISVFPSAVDLFFCSTTCTITEGLRRTGTHSQNKGRQSPSVSTIERGTRKCSPAE